MDGFDRAKVYFKKLKRIEDFVGGDAKVAKMILDGVIKDLIIIKGRYKDREETSFERYKDTEETNFGLFTIYINKLHPEVLKISNIVSQLPSLYNYKPLREAFEFQFIIDRELDEGMYDLKMTKLFSTTMKKAITTKVISDLIFWIENNLIAEITDYFTKIIADMLSAEGVAVLIDFENISSAAFFDKSKSDIKIEQHPEDAETTENTEAAKDTQNTEAAPTT